MPNSTTYSNPFPVGEVKAVPGGQVALALELPRARERNKWGCPACGSSDGLHSYANGGFRCFAGCGERSYSNIDVAGIVFGINPTTNFLEVVRLLADRVGVHAPGAGYTSPPPPREDHGDLDVAHAALLAALAPDRSPEVYGAALATTTLTDPGCAYLEGRGLDADQAAAYGFRSLDSFDDWARLAGDLLDAGYNVTDLVAAGLFRRSKRGGAPFLANPFHPHPFPPVLAIPYVQGGQVVAIRFRSTIPDAHHGQRYRTLAGKDPSVPFNVDAITAGETCYLVEGDINAFTLHQHGLHAVGLPGAGRFKPEWANLFRDVSRLVCWFDADPAGQAGVRKVADTLVEKLGRGWVEERAVAIMPPADANDMHCQGGLDAWTR